MPAVSILLALCVIVSLFIEGVSNEVAVTTSKFTSAEANVHLRHHPDHIPTNPDQLVQHRQYHHNNAHHGQHLSHHNPHQSLHSSRDAHTDKSSNPLDGEGRADLSLCVDPGHRICQMNDTFCGVWRGRHWRPSSCRYSDVTTEQARKCIGNRTIAFIGDSQIRDTMIGVVNLLMGMSFDEAPDAKVDKHHNFRIKDSTIIGAFDRWTRNSDSHNLNGNVFPLKNIAKEKGYAWQIQMWGLFRNEFTDNRQAEDVLNNVMVPYNQSTLGLRKIDFAFWSHGIHDWGWWDKPPYGKKYWDVIINRWIRIRKRVKVPSVWVSMNNNCLDKLKLNGSPFNAMNVQYEMIEDANVYVNKKMLEEKLPYWDASAVLRTLQRCQLSADGIHVKMWVDLQRAKILFNHLCDKDFNWIASEHRFTT